MEQDEQPEISISPDPWKDVCDSYPIGLIEAIFWLAGSTLLQMGVSWLFENGHLNRPSWSPEFGPQVAVMMLNTLVLLLYLKFIRKAELRLLGLRFDRLPGDLRFTLLAAVVASVIYLCMAGIVWLGMPLFVEDRDAQFIRWLHQAAYEHPSALYLLGVVVAFPVLEEIWFRGLMYAPMRKEWGKWASIIILSLLFAFAHSNTVPVNQFIGGLIFVWAYEKRRTLVAPIILHALGNGSLWVLGIALEYFGI